MRFETIEDTQREQKAIKSFVRIFQGSFKKLGENDIDYKVFNKEVDLVAYAEVKGRLRPMSKAFPLPVAVRKLVKLSDKRLNPIMIWACEDGLIYSPVDKLKGEIRWEVDHQEKAQSMTLNSWHTFLSLRSLSTLSIINSSSTSYFISFI